MPKRGIRALDCFIGWNILTRFILSSDFTPTKASFFSNIGPGSCLSVDCPRGLENHCKRYQRALPAPSDPSSPPKIRNQYIKSLRAKQSLDSRPCSCVFVTVSMSFNLARFQIAQRQRWSRYSLWFLIT